MTDETTTASSRRRLIGELFVSAGSNAGLMIALTDNAVLGRDDQADVTLADTSGELSRRHARISLIDGVPYIEDLASTNGTFLNGERLQAPARLSAGDRIRVGATTLDFTPAPDLQPEPAAQVTRAHETMQATRAHETAPQVTRAREVVPQVTQVRDVAAPSEPPSTGDGPPAEHEPTYAAAGTDGELTILSGPGAGKSAPVRISATIGREPECDLQVLDSEVSRRHAKVTIRDGTAVIDDLHSSNGTYVNGERILERHTLAPGERIQIGEATIELTSPVFEGVALRPAPAQVSGMREVIARSPELLGAASGNRKWWTLAVVLATVFMLLLDVTIVAVALPTISKSLHPSFSSLQWIVDGYTIMLTSALLTAGSMADIFGRKKVLMIGVVIFTIASVLCAQAPTATVLDFSRGLQGVGGAVMFACSLALIVQEFPANERALAFGAYGATNGISVALGPIVGGLLVQSLGWQSIFYLNVPIGIAALYVLHRRVVNLPGPETKIDWPGLVTFSGAMFLAIFATIRGNDDGWTSSTSLICYGASVLLFAAFAMVELRRQFPMFELRLFKNPTFIGASVSAFTVCFSVLALIFFLTTWLQSILGYSAVGTGLRMLVFTGVALAVGPFAGKMTNSVSPQIVLPVSLLLAALGGLQMTSVGPHSSWTAIIPGLVLAGLALGLSGPTLASTAVGVVPPWRGGMAGGMNSTMRESGTTAGIAVLGALIQHHISAHVTTSLAGSPIAGQSKVIASAISSGGTRQLVPHFPPQFHAGLLTVARESYAGGLSTIFLVAGIVAAVGAVISVALVRRSHLREDAAGGH